MVTYKTIVTWNEIHQNIGLLHSRTKEFDGSNPAIVGIARGGLVPAVLLSQLKENSVVYSAGIKSYIKSTRGKESVYQLPKKNDLEKHSAIYLVDDICDTGLTFKFLLEKTFLNLNIKTISLFNRSNSLYLPDYVGTTLLSESWVVFPWENE